MKRVLLVDPNFSATPLRRAIRKAGRDVFTVGLMADAGASDTDPNHLQINYASIPELAAAVRSLDVAALVPGCTDVSYEVCCRIADQFNMPGLDALDAFTTLHQKREFRRLCERVSVPAPKVYEDCASAAAAGAPVIVKPVDAYSGRGITVISDPSSGAIFDAVSYAEKFSTSGGVIIEEFVQGQLKSYSAFLNSGRVMQGFIVSEFCINSPYSVDLSYVDENPSLELKLRADIERIAKELGVDQGLIHIQLIQAAENYWVIEGTRRCPGDLYSELIRLSHQFDYGGAYVAPFLGTPLPAGLPAARAPVVRQTVTSTEPGFLESISFSPSARLMSWSPLCKSGDFFSGESPHRLGIAFYQLESHGDIGYFVERATNGDLSSVRMR